MPWVKFDDQFPIHRKVKGLTDAEFRLHTEAIFWCARNMTDGYVASHELRDVSGISKPERHLTALVSRGLWVEQEGGGWRLHDYLEYQPSRSKVLQMREIRKEAGSIGGKRSGETRAGRKPAAKKGSGSKSEAKPKQSASRFASPPAPFLLKKEGTESPPASQGGGLPSEPEPAPPPVDWRKQKAFGAQPDPQIAETAQRGAAAARALIRKPAHTSNGRTDPLAELAQAVAELSTPEANHAETETSTTAPVPDR